MDGMLDAFRAVAEKLTYHQPSIPVVSALTGRLADGEQLRDPGHWVRHVRETVRFADAVTALTASGAGRFVELGPDAVLTGLARACGTPTAPSSSRSAAATAVSPPRSCPASPGCTPTASPPTGRRSSPVRPARTCPPTPSGAHGTG